MVEKDIRVSLGFSGKEVFILLLGIFYFRDLLRRGNLGRVYVFRRLYVIWCYIWRGCVYIRES